MKFKDIHDHCPKCKSYNIKSEVIECDSITVKETCLDCGWDNEELSHEE